MCSFDIIPLCALNIPLAEDLLRDIDKEMSDFAARRRAAKMAKATAGGSSAAATAEPSSLWDELLDVGEEFVEFLEQGLATDADEQAAYNSYRGATRRAMPSETSSGNSGDGSRSASGSTGSSNSSGSVPPRPPPPPPQSAAEAVEAELQALKRKLGKQ